VKYAETLPAIHSLAFDRGRWGRVGGGIIQVEITQSVNRRRFGWKRRGRGGARHHWLGTSVRV